MQFTLSFAIELWTKMKYRYNRSQFRPLLTLFSTLFFVQLHEVHKQRINSCAQQNALPDAMVAQVWQRVTVIDFRPPDHIFFRLKNYEIVILI